MSRGIGGHHRAYEGKNNEWLTPPHIVESLGRFDTDPCSPISRPWDTARIHYNELDDGLSKEWFGRVWLNPPYGPHTGAWLRKLIEHGNGIALIFARTETDVWQKYVWGAADSVLFLYGRLFFHYVDGTRAKHNSGGPSALVAYGANNTLVLENCNLAGYFARIK